MALHPEHTHTPQNLKDTVSEFDTIKLKLHFTCVYGTAEIIQLLYSILLVFQPLYKFASYL